MDKESMELMIEINESWYGSRVVNYNGYEKFVNSLFDNIDKEVW
jgi:hypothetical protein